MHNPYFYQIGIISDTPSPNTWGIYRCSFAFSQFAFTIQITEKLNKTRKEISAFLVYEMICASLPQGFHDFRNQTHFWWIWLKRFGGTTLIETLYWKHFPFISSLILGISRDIKKSSIVLHFALIVVSVLASVSMFISSS